MIDAIELGKRAAEAQKEFEKARETLRKTEEDLLIAWLSAFAFRQKNLMTDDREVEYLQTVLEQVAKMTKAANDGKDFENCHISMSHPYIKGILSKVYQYSGTDFEFQLKFK